MKYSWILILLIIILGFTIRAYKLTQAPSALYIDEVSIGYNAWSIITTGKDEYKVKFPLFFKAFGEYKLPVYIYLTSISELIFGINDAAVRIPSVVLGTLTIWGMYLTIKEIMNLDQSLEKYFWWSYLGAFLLAVSPWHYQYSRPGFEANAALCFTVFGVWGFIKSVNSNKLSWMIFSSLMWLLSLYSYSSSRIITPLLVFFLFILYFRKLKLKIWIISGLIAFLLFIPYIKFTQSPEGMIRAKEMLFMTYYPEQPVKRFIDNYLLNISYKNLFIQGDSIFNTPFRYGLFHKAEIPFLMIGIIVLLLILKNRIKWFIIYWSLVGFIPASLTIQNPHNLRNLLVLPSIILITSLGVSYLIYILKKKIFKIIFLSLFIFTLFISQLYFMNLYFEKVDQHDEAWVWQVASKAAIIKLNQIKSNYDFIYIDKPDNGINPITLSWYMKIKPSIYQKSVQFNKLNNIFINFDNAELIPRNNQNLFVTNQSIDRGIRLDEIYNANGRMIYTIWRI